MTPSEIRQACTRALSLITMALPHLPEYLQEPAQRTMAQLIKVITEAALEEPITESLKRRPVMSTNTCERCGAEHGYPVYQKLRICDGCYLGDPTLQPPDTADIFERAIEAANPSCFEDIPHDIEIELESFDEDIPFDFDGTLNIAHVGCLDNVHVKLQSVYRGRSGKRWGYYSMDWTQGEPWEQD